MQNTSVKQKTDCQQWHYLVWHITFLKNVDSKARTDLIRDFAKGYKIPISDGFLDVVTSTQENQVDYGIMVSPRFELTQRDELKGKFPSIWFEIVKEFEGFVGSSLQEDPIDSTYVTIDEFYQRIKDEGFLCPEYADELEYIHYDCADPRVRQNKEDFEFHWLKYLVEYWIERADIIYIPQLEEFVIYNPKRGVYEFIIVEKVKQAINVWLDVNELKQGKNHIADALEQVKINCHKELHEFDNNSNFVNVENGLIDIHTKHLLPHRREHYSLIQFPIKYSEGINKTPHWESMKSYYPNQMKIVELFIKAVFYDDLWIRKGLFLIGKPNTGKSTVLNVIRRAFGNDILTEENVRVIAKKKPAIKDMCSTYGLNLFEDKRVLEDLTRKRVNIDTDMKIDFLSSDAIASLKKIWIGEPVDCEAKFKKPFNHLLHLFTINATNQFPKLPPSVDREGFFKRVCIIEFDHIFGKDDEFEKGLNAEISSIMSNLIQEDYDMKLQDYLLMNKNYEQVLNDTMLMWDEHSDPIAKFCNLFYERSTGINDVISCVTIQDEIKNALENEGIDVPKSIINQITSNLRFLGITRRQSRKNGDNYVGIKRSKNNPNDPSIEEQLEFEDKEQNIKEKKGDLMAFGKQKQLLDEKTKNVLDKLKEIKKTLGKDEVICFEDIETFYANKPAYPLRLLRKILLELEEREEIVEIKANRFIVR